MLVDRLQTAVRPAGEPRVLAPMCPRGRRTRARARPPGRPWRAVPPRARVVAAAELPDELDEPLRLLGERSAPLEEGDRPEPAGERVDPDGDVAVERERGVLEPGLEHLHVPGPHDAGSPPFATSANRLPPAGSSAGGPASPSRRRAGAGAGSARRTRLQDDRPLGQVDDLASFPSGSRQSPSASRPSRMRRSRSAASGSTSAARSVSRYAAAVGTRRARREAAPEENPPPIVSRSSFSQTQRTGREKRCPLAPTASTSRRSPWTIARSRSSSTSAHRPARDERPSRPSRSSSSSARGRTSARSPGRGASRSATGGPCDPSSGVRSGSSSTRKASRRGPTKTCVGSTPRCSRTRPRQLRLRLVARRCRQLLAADLKQERRQASPCRASRPSG